MIPSTGCQKKSEKIIKIKYQTHFHVTKQHSGHTVQVPDAAFEKYNQIYPTCPFPASAPPPTHRHPVKGIGAQNTTFWQNALGSFTQTKAD